MGSDNIRDQILADAIRTAIEAEKKIQILKGAVGILIGLLLLALLFL